MNESADRRIFYTVFLIGFVIVITIFFATGVINVDIGCDNCGTWLRADDKFCKECGTAAYEYCSNCNYVIEDNEKFCTKCGVKIIIDKEKVE